MSSSMVPETRLPSLSAGMLPEQKTKPLAFIAWDYLGNQYIHPWYATGRRTYVWASGFLIDPTSEG